MKFLSVLVFMLFISCATHQKQVDATIDKDGYLVGITDKQSFLDNADFAQWFNAGYSSYQVDNEVLNEIKPLLKNIEIKAVMGTWCGDSRREVPHFYKILDELDFNYKNLTMIAVDRSKNTTNNDTDDLMITRVPTFIFYQDGKEINRIVEYPIHSLEQDMFQILSDNNYKNAYFE